jgi:hypothetical protein
MNEIVEIVKKGVWLYDNSIEMPVSIIKQNWDYYFEEGYTEGEPSLNSEAYAFYVVGEKQKGNSYVSRSKTFNTIEEAKAYAESNYNKLIWF